ncbi:MAM and LDL-receptor class A domain-containing protein 1-like [Hylaeus anthracinus]|uniref:MAM and LDL-receptor class A domain-containing protein 1-like n=1 Tax=Hylaeus anthracinus TaxID=313031 RepID=UPI0023B91079|nr:MAM and LDL-receptor class A domain-containing protein 1-like [Hylaeus anthracinus]XP_054010884.1 MAM and LDL-receptor class A domain-containing protein 1-like [Hylaeus anthracinus]
MKNISSPALVLLLSFLVQCVVCSIRCPMVRLPNGRVRARARGKIIRFNCYEGFTLVGNRYSTCIRGEWDTPTPVCVNNQCPEFPTPKHALVATKYNGAILIYFCEPGYALIGPAEIYCDGRQWNGTAPYCRDTNATAPTQCDFEKPDLCWWEQDPQHDFDWRRHNFETPSSHIGTGPTHDHTLGQGNDGYYLYIEASGRLVNDTARIISPIYNATYTEAGCFSFWYHMYGATTGALNVYFKQEKDITPRLMFTREGNQGNQWLQGTFNLPKAEKGFQIIIEGVRGSSYVSDIAIDDVAILQGDKCQNTNKTEREGVTESDDDQIELVNAQLTCRGQCKNTYSYNLTSLPDECLCTLDCAEHSNCCPDYAEYCVLAFTDDGTTEFAEAVTLSRKTTLPVTTPPAKKDNASDAATLRSEYYEGKGISIIPKDDIDPVPLKPSTSTVGTVANATTPRTSKTTRPTTPRIFRTTRPTTSTVATMRAVQTKETPFTQTTTSRYAQPEEEPDPSVTRHDLEKVHRGSAKFSLPGIIGVVVGTLTGASITLMVAIIILRRRKTYKRSANGSALSEDSDVRFLTSDEILDFTLARPSDNDETKT